MFFKSHFISIADIIDSKFRSYQQIVKNPADKGELCEIFMKEFLLDALDDSFKIFRGGRIVNSTGNESKQMDIVLVGKRTIKLFGDKGIYPTESVFGCISITSTLTKQKLYDCCSEFKSIPKKDFHLHNYGCFSEKFVFQSINIWRTLLPYKVIFAYQGALEKTWIKDIYDFGRDEEIPYNVLPDLIIVNKLGFIEKIRAKDGVSAELQFFPFSKYPNYGLPFGKMLFNLNNANWEEFILQPQLEFYLNKDI
ncbi:MAG: hypothetical protein IPJ81_17155 [Chitinophagaceae bacterium]|nr:hypothetical protein [Chitinophagaceae bacterium]